MPTLREILAILSWAIVGNATCHFVKERNLDIGKKAFTAAEAYFSRVLGIEEANRVNEYERRWRIGQNVT